MDTSTTFEYAAFISYRHQDNAEEQSQWATWLHHQLEIYDVPAELVGTTNLRGERIPERIYPVYRDEVSQSVDPNLSAAITNALDQSRFLVVLCSPRAVQSRYVNREITHFKTTGKEDRIIAALLLGEPNASIDPSKEQDPEDARTLECFPQALQYGVDSSGELLLDRPAELLAADFRLPTGGKGITNPSIFKQRLLEEGESRVSAEQLASAYEEKIRNALLKIIAGILGVRLETLTERDKIHQLRRAQNEARRARLVGTAMTGLFLIAAAAATVAWTQFQNVQRERDRLQSVYSEFWLNPNTELRLLLRSGGTSPEFTMLPAGGSFLGDGLAIGTHEITIGDYRLYCERSGACKASDERAELPLTGVSVAVMMAYTEWLANETGAKVRIPTYSEWAYASTPGGGKINCNNPDYENQTLYDATSGRANLWGIKNLLGNAAELLMVDDGLVVVGGSYADRNEMCTVTSLRPVSGHADQHTGFRLVLETLKGDAELRVGDSDWYAYEHRD